MQNWCLTLLALACLWPKGASADRPAASGPHPEKLAARWFEEGYQAEWRLSLRSDGRGVKERHRECLNAADQEGCMTLRYEGSWDADRGRLVLHLPGGMVEAFRY